MKQRIHGISYDTDTAILLASEEPWAVASGGAPGLRKKFLFRTPEGRYFIWHRTQWEKARDILEPLTSDAAKRLTEHNAGNCTHTAKHRPWSVDVVIEFADERRAVAFERYLKSGSGVAFAQRHLR